MNKGKKKYARLVRHKIRRALNKSMDAFTKLGIHKARKICYGSGLSMSHVKEQKED